MRFQTKFNKVKTTTPTSTNTIVFYKVLSKKCVKSVIIYKREGKNKRSHIVFDQFEKKKKKEKAVSFILPPLTPKYTQTHNTNSQMDQIYNEMKIAWMNEKSSPEILPFQSSLYTQLTEELSKQQEIITQGVSNVQVSKKRVFKNKEKKIKRIIKKMKK